MINSTIPSSQSISCTVTLNFFDNVFSNNVFASGTVVRNGSTGKCTMRLPYIWEVLSAKKTMTVSAEVSTSGAFGSSQPSGTASLSFAAFPCRTVPRLWP